MAVEVIENPHNIEKGEPTICIRNNSFERQHSASKVHHLRTALSKQPQNETLSDLPKNKAQHESISFLPSYVSESIDLVNVESQVETLPEPSPPDGVQEVGKMNTQNEMVNGTQQLSQSIYDDIILRSKSTSIPEDVQDQEMRDEHSTGTQHTLNEGDDGHIDITSSFVTHHGPPEDLQDSEPVEFSPSQSQHHMTQYPESQRFKTPATAGKKRNYKGDTIETPSLPRNPLARSGGPTPRGLMGLSQAFADTQAVSSPLSNGLPTAFRSDRPSPNIELQTKIANVSSSPLSMLPNVRRAVTEPSTRYIPMKQSQAERERQVELERKNELDEEESDGFEDESSLTKRRRREKERDQKIRKQLREASPPLSPLLTSPVLTRGGTLSSPIRPLERSPIAKAASPSRGDETTTTPYPRIIDPEAESELETEQEDEGGVNVRRSSQIRQPGIEDKENQVKYVQDTVVQLQRVINGSVSQVEASPCTRYSSNMPLKGAMHSSEPLRIADSQPSQTNRDASSSKPTTSSGTDVIDFVGQGSPLDQTTTRLMSEQDVSSEIPDGILNRGSDHAGTGAVPSVDDSTLNGKSENTNVTSADGNGTIAETNPEAVGGMTGNAPGSETVGIVMSAGSTSKFDTAQTHRSSQQNGVSSSQVSSQPIIRTPARSRRRRLMDVSADNSPLNMTPSFNAAQVLQLDQDEDMAGFLETSPNHMVTYSHKRRRMEPKPTRTRNTEHHPSKVADSVPSPVSIKEPFLAEDDMELDDAPEMSQEIIQPTRQNRLARSTILQSSPKTATTSRQSLWDLEASPVKSKSTNSKESKKTSLKNRVKAKLEERIQPTLSVTTPKVIDTAVPTGNNSPDPLAMTVTSSEVTTSTPEPSNDGVSRPNMVFAFYNGTQRAYYPAVYLGHAGTSTTKFKIQWEGYAPDEVDSYGIKALDLRVGDVVKINLKQFPKMPYIIRGFKDKVEDDNDTITDIRGYRTLIVTPKPRKNVPPRITIEPQKEVPISAVYLDSQMWQQLRNRQFDFTQHTTANQSLQITPAPRFSTPGTPSSRHKRTQPPSSIIETPSTIPGIFTNMAFAISYESSSRKETLTDLILSQGGLILENSFHDLLIPSPSIDTSNQKIELKPQFTSLGFTVLLTERHSRKEKYMHALALGLPCLNGRWIDSCIRHGEVVDWKPYLLPAGESEELEGATRSRILDHVDPHTVRLADVLEKRFNMLMGKDVVIVMGRGKMEIKRQPYVFLVRALGAGRVERVGDVRSAREVVEKDERYKWVFVDDRDLNNARDSMGNKSASGKLKEGIDDGTGVRVVGNELIVQSLILGMLYDC